MADKPETRKLPIRVPAHELALALRALGPKCSGFRVLGCRASDFGCSGFRVSGVGVRIFEGLGPSALRVSSLRGCRICSGSSVKGPPGCGVWDHGFRSSRAWGLRAWDCFGGSGTSSRIFRGLFEARIPGKEAFLRLSFNGN